MQRCQIAARPGWREEVSKYLPTDTLWAEGTYYRFTDRQIEQLESATAELRRLMLAAVDKAVNDPAVFARFHIPAAFEDMVRASWKRNDPSVYERLDLVYDGKNPPKLIEYNGDSPALLSETGAVQWFWFEGNQSHFPGADQFNTVHEELQATWAAVKARLSRPNEAFHFVSSRHSNTADDDWYVCEYHAEVARECGIRSKQLFIENITLDWKRGILADQDGEPISKLFKLYPWNWFKHDVGGKILPELSKSSLGIIEPPWKMLVDHKALLALLWEMFPQHPNLLPTFWDHHPSLGERYVTKPIYGCEGENVTIHAPTGVVGESGTYGDDPLIYQQYCELPTFDNVRTLIGSWVVGGKPCGLIVREGEGLITNNKWKIAPHLFVEA